MTKATYLYTSDGVPIDKRMYQSISFNLVIDYHVPFGDDRVAIQVIETFDESQILLD